MTKKNVEMVRYVPLITIISLLTAITLQDGYYDDMREAFLSCITFVFGFKFLVDKKYFDLYSLFLTCSIILFSLQIFVCTILEYLNKIRFSDMNTFYVTLSITIVLTMFFINKLEE